jgi:hypothetical protein
MYSHKTAALVSMCLVGLAAPVSAQKYHEQGSLANVGAIAVVVQAIPADAERDGLTRELLQTLIEQQLQKNGIPLRSFVSSSSSSVPTPGYLSVKVTMFKAQALSRTIGFVYAYNLHVGFKQQVQLATNKAYITAETWTQNTLGIHPAPKLQELNKRVLDLVNQFSDDYLTVNPVAVVMWRERRSQAEAR